MDGSSSYAPTPDVVVAVAGVTGTYQIDFVEVYPENLSSAPDQATVDYLFQDLPPVSITSERAGAGDLLTGFSSNLSGGIGGGVYFDLAVGRNGVTITGLDCNLASPEGSRGAIEMWVLPGGSHVGNENDRSRWLLAGSGTCRAMGVNVRTSVQFDLPAGLPAGNYGVAICAVGLSHAVINGNGANQRVVSPHMTLTAGSMLTPCFGTGNPQTPVVFSGALHHFVGAAGRFALAQPLGTGCGQPPLAHTATRPRLGSVATLTVTDLPAPRIGVAMIGGALSPGLDLTTIGMAGCTLFVGPLITSLPFASSGSTGTLTLPIPPNSNLVGVSIASQGLAVSPAANPLGLVTSNGMRLTLGEN